MTRSTKQERAYQKRRHEKWERRNRERAIRNRRIVLVTVVVVGLALAALTATWFAVFGRGVEEKVEGLLDGQYPEGVL